MTSTFCLALASWASSWLTWYSNMRRSNWNSGWPFFTGTLGSTSTAISSVGCGRRGVSWMVCWMIFASVA